MKISDLQWRSNKKDVFILSEPRILISSGEKSGLREFGYPHESATIALRNGYCLEKDLPSEALSFQKDKYSHAGIKTAYAVSQC
ncbi:MAG: hypothetical protein ACK5RO_05060 [Pseudobdellovibrionaceae bacterium]